MKKRSKREIAIRKAHIDGFRPFVMYPSVGSFKGCYNQTHLQGYGVKTFYKSNLVYDGQWLKSKCHGQGTLRRLTNDGTSERIYIGQWFEGKRCGEGKMFHKDGIYYGWWKGNKPHGKGIMWYDDGRLYIGQWEYGLYHGAGVLFYMNGNRYEGNFENGLKHGEGLFFHNETGQLQKGVWCVGMCKTSIMFDEFRNQATSPTPYPIPKSKLFEPDNLVKKIFKEYLPELPVQIKGDLTCIDLITKFKM